MNSIIAINNLKNTAISGMIIALFFFFSIQVLAADISVAVVDIPTIMKKAPQVEDSSHKLNAKFLPLKNKLEEELREIEQLEILKDAVEISAKEKNLRERDIRRRRLEHRRAVEDFREELRFARDLALDEVQAEVYEAIHIIRKQLHIDIIIQEYVSRNPKVDITSQVLNYLEKKMRQKQTNRNNTPTEKNNDSHFIPQ